MIKNSTATTSHPAAQPCKICDHLAPFWEACDFSTHCERLRSPDLIVEPSGISVPYYRCGNCGFVFTPFMDAFSDDDFKTRVYNEDYIKFDPGFEGDRAAYQGKMLVDSFGAEPITLCDYGGGRGHLAAFINTTSARMRAVSWDPYFDLAERPLARFDMVISYEAFEHSTNPRASFEDMLSFCDDNRVLLMTTLCQPPDIEKIRTGWWYCAPRNGHISLHTRRSLQWLADEAGLGVMHLEDGVTSDGVHLFYDRIPAWLAPKIGL